MAKIHKAARKGDLEAVAKLLDKGEDVDSTERLTGQTPLHCAAGNGHLDLVRLLLERGADTGKNARMIGMPLFCAADAETVRLLIDGGADPLAAADDGRTAIHDHAEYDHRECIEVLLEHGVEVDLPGKNGKTALCVAAEHGRNDLVRFLLERGADPNARTTEGQTVLDAVAAFGSHRAETMELLQNAGAEREKLGKLESWVEADKEAKATGKEERKLLGAVKAHDAKTVGRLLEEGYDPDLDDGDSTALHWALAEGCGKESELEVLRLLIDAGADVNRRTKTGLSAEDRRRYWGEYWMQAKIVDAFFRGFVRGSVAHEIGIGFSPLDFTAQHNDGEAARLLVKAGADVDAQGEDGQAALHICTAFAAEQTTRVLVEAGADVNVRTESEGETPLRWAERTLGYILTPSVKRRAETVADLIRRAGGVE